MIEGGAKEGGRGPSIWDTFCQERSDKIADKSNGDIAVDSYHRYKEDVSALEDMGMNAYRFSISWSRILPRGKISDGVNKEGVAYYNNLINELIKKGIKPFVTLFHWDLPQTLEDEYGGFMSSMIVDDFIDYADVCFQEFGDRVEHWITINEPNMFSAMGYDIGCFAPGKNDEPSVYPYQVNHNQLLAHAAVVKLYREKYQHIQRGLIGLTLVSHWMIPYDNSDENDILAADRAVQFMFGWIMDPLTNGDYPPVMKQIVGTRLPEFTDEQSKMLKGSFDFVGANYYTGRYVLNVPMVPSQKPMTYNHDFNAKLLVEKDGVLIGPKASLPWLHVYPEGIKEFLVYIKKRYNNPVIYITENGIDDVKNEHLGQEEALQDTMRVEYFYKHLYYVKEAMRDGADVRGYFAWSIIDNFEWQWGYTIRFGLYYVDFKDGLKRYPKASAKWFKKFLTDEDATV